MLLLADGFLGRVVTSDELYDATYRIRLGENISVVDCI